MLQTCTLRRARIDIINHNTHGVSYVTDVSTQRLRHVLIRTYVSKIFDVCGKSHVIDPKIN